MSAPVKPPLIVTSAPLRQRGEALAARYDLPLARKLPGSGWYLSLQENGLTLCDAGDPVSSQVTVEFAAGTMAHRLRFGGGRGQPLARAIGMKPGFTPTIWDATAGLGRDGFVLASLGSEVVLCERSPALAAMLDEGLQRAALDADLAEWVESRLKLVHADSATCLLELPGHKQPDTVYLDPMYPPGKAHVLVKKEIRAVQALVGPDQDSTALLEAALQTARRRVVVKRPKRAGWLAERKPSTSIESKKTRYDVYVTLRPETR